MTEVPRERVLLVRRAGSLWAVAHAAVRDVMRSQEAGGTFRVHMAPGANGAGGALTVDELVGVVDGLPVWPGGRVMSRYWSEPVAGLTVHAATPMVVVDPERPPSFLRTDSDDETERIDGDDR